MLATDIAGHCIFTIFQGELQAMHNSHIILEELFAITENYKDE